MLATANGVESRRRGMAGAIPISSNSEQAPAQRDGQQQSTTRLQRDKNGGSYLK